jgi:hypothetical protein
MTNIGLRACARAIARDRITGRRGKGATRGFIIWSNGRETKICLIKT